MSPLLRNAWYVAAWSHEVGRELLERTVLDEPLVLYRCEDGAPVVMGSRCPHRFAPLHLGKLVGDEVECPYHGLRVGPMGECVHNPHGKVPSKATLSTFPTVDKHDLIWIWPGGPEASDERTIPDFRARAPGAGSGPGQLRKPVDHWLYMRWDKPGHMLLDVGVTPPGGSRAEGVWTLGTDILTPIDSRSTLYFWGLSRNYGLDDPELDAWAKASIDIAFEGQDKPMVEAQQRMLAGRDFEELTPASFPSDAGPNRVRKVMRRLIQEGAPPSPAGFRFSNNLAAPREARVVPVV